MGRRGVTTHRHRAVCQRALCRGRPAPVHRPRGPEWIPPARLAFTWQISMNRQPVPDPERASLVEVRFVAAEEGTQVHLTHRAFGWHGGDGRAYRDARWRRPHSDPASNRCMGPSRPTSRPVATASARPTS
ncbi:MAG: hypothetical protein GVY35_13245 [Bacteroidetes bacterium]|nr:hypothetical protein [Bacteroidota bacterium]